MPQRGDPVPHFAVTTVQGEPFSYSDIWQRKNLLLITLPQNFTSASAGSYITELTARLRELDEHDAACVITADHVPHVPPAGALVADRWGEIVFAVATSDVSALPPPRELMEWLTFVKMRCPECEGEAK